MELFTKDYYVFFGITFMGFLALMNPLLSISVFLNLTAQEDKNNIKNIAIQSLLTAFIIVFVFSLAGNYILNFFGITFSALKLTGGIVVSVIGYEMLHGKQSNVHNPSKETIQKSKEEEVSVALTPLGVPLLAGPGIIITAMNFASRGGIYQFITIMSFAILCIITYFCFMLGKKINEILGTSFIKAATRMMGLVLNVIGIQMILQGIYSAIKNFS